MSENSTAVPAAGGPAEPARQGRPKLKTVRDMVLSLAVICAVAFALFLFTPLVPGDAAGDPGPPEVEYRVAAGTAARAAPYPLLIPEGLGPDWRATSVRYLPEGEHGATWRLGLLDPDDEYAALAQADGDAAAFVSAVTRGAGDTGGTERVAGRDWARYAGEKYDALVLSGPGVTTVVLGTAPTARLAHLAAALEPAAS